jgi:hypothetical protein
VVTMEWNNVPKGESPFKPMAVNTFDSKWPAGILSATAFHEKAGRSGSTRRPCVADNLIRRFARSVVTGLPSAGYPALPVYFQVGDPTARVGLLVSCLRMTFHISFTKSFNVANARKLVVHLGSDRARYIGPRFSIPVLRRWIDESRDHVNRCRRKGISDGCGTDWAV